MFLIQVILANTLNKRNESIIKRQVSIHKRADGLWREFLWKSAKNTAAIAVTAAAVGGVVYGLSKKEENKQKNDVDHFNAVNQTPTLVKRNYLEKNWKPLLIGTGIGTTATAAVVYAMNKPKENQETITTPQQATALLNKQHLPHQPVYPDTTIPTAPPAAIVMPAGTTGKSSLNMPPPSPIR